MSEMMICVGITAFFSLEDIRKRTVMVWKLILLAPIGIYFVLFEDGVIFSQSLIGILIGLLFVTMSLVTGGKLGMADAVVIIFLGAMLGYSAQIRVLCYSFLAAFICSMIILLRHKNRPMTIPFLPCLFLGCLWLLIIYQGGIL